MTVDIFTGEANREPVILPDRLIRYDRHLDDLKDGENGFVDVEALWAHPDTRVLHVDAAYDLLHYEDTVEQDIPLLGLARVAKYKGSIVVDISHIIETMRELAGELKGTLDDPKFTTPSEIALPEMMQYSHPVDGLLIQDNVTLALFNDHLTEVYGEEAILPILVVEIPEDLPED